MSYQKKLLFKENLLNNAKRKILKEKNFLSRLLVKKKDDE